MAWPIVFALTTWPLFSFLPAWSLVTIAYYFMHIRKDARRKGVYANPPVRCVLERTTCAAGDGHLAESVCRVMGWSLAVLGLLFAFVTCWASFKIWNNLDGTLPYELNQVLSESKIKALGAMSVVAKIITVSFLVSVVAVFGGAIFIHQAGRLGKLNARDEGNRDGNAKMEHEG